MSRTVSVHVGYVDVDLSDIDTKDLAAELDLRGKGVQEMPEIGPQLADLYLALKLGRNDMALTLARKLVCDATGKVL